MKTRLSLSATPGKNYSSFAGKAEASTGGGSASIMMLGVG